MLLVAALIIITADSTQASLLRLHHRSLQMTTTSTSSDNTLDTAKIDAVMDKYRDRFSGVVQLQVAHGPAKDPQLQEYTVTLGLAHEEFLVAMPADAIFPIASNSKLFTAVCLYQLQERGLVDLLAPVNDYLDGSDFEAFGFANQTKWCPRVEGAPADSPCEQVTFVDVMRMSSGIGSTLNCDNVPQDRCHESPNDLAIYHGSIGAHVGQFINDPLVFKPGTNYSYSNPNYILLAYLVEKLSGQDFASYIDSHIAQPLGLNDTYFDPWSAQTHLRQRYVSQYAHVFALGRGNSSELTYVSSGTCAPYTNSGVVSGTGGIRSTVADMQRWYMDLFHNRGRASKLLMRESILNILHRRNPVEPRFAQGVAVMFPEETKSEWPEYVSYSGAMKCSVTFMDMSFDATDSSKSVIVSAFSNAVSWVFPNITAAQEWRPYGFYGVPLSEYTTLYDEAEITNGLVQAIVAVEGNSITPNYDDE